MAQKKIAGLMPPNLSLENMPVQSHRLYALYSRLNCFWMLLEPFKIKINSWGPFQGGCHPALAAE